jgi:hypothetical protein
MKRPFILFSVAVTAIVLFVSGSSSGSACQDDHHGLRGKCRITVVGGVYHYDCVSAIDPEDTNCTYYVE